MNELEAVLEELSVGAPVDRADWQDVVARSRRPYRKRLTIVALTLAILALVASPAFGVGGRLLDLFSGDPVKTEQLSKDQLQVLGAMATGFSVRVPASAQESLTRAKAAHLRLIATRDGRSYYVANLAGGGLCVTITWPGDPDPLRGYLCSPNFPSPRQPVADKSAFAGAPEAPKVRRLEGFAADGVTAIEVIAANGSRVTTPVEDNVYLRTDGLPRTPVREVLALDASGQPVATVLTAPAHH